MMFVVKLWLSVLLVLPAFLRGSIGVSATTDGSDTEAIPFPDLYEASVLELQAGLDAGHFTSVDLVKVRDFCLVEVTI